MSKDLHKKTLNYLSDVVKQIDYQLHLEKKMAYQLYDELLEESSRELSSDIDSPDFDPEVKSELIRKLRQLGTGPNFFIETEIISPTIDHKLNYQKLFLEFLNKSDETIKEKLSQNIVFEKYSLHKNKINLHFIKLLSEEKMEEAIERAITDILRYIYISHNAINSHPIDFKITGFTNTHEPYCNYLYLDEDGNLCGWYELYQFLKTVKEEK